MDPAVYQSVLLGRPGGAQTLTDLEGKTPSPSRVRAFKRHMTVIVDKKDLSSIVNIQIEATDPAFAANAANALALALVSWDRNRRARQPRALHRRHPSVHRRTSTGSSRTPTPRPTRRFAAARCCSSARKSCSTARSSADSAVFVGLLEPLAMATPPQLAVGPRVVLKTFVAMVTGLFGAYLLLFLRWSLDRRVRGRGDLIGLGGRPLLAEFPRPSPPRPPPVQGGRQLPAARTCSPWPDASCRWSWP